MPLWHRWRESCPIGETVKDYEASAWYGIVGPDTTRSGRNAEEGNQHCAARSKNQGADRRAWRCADADDGNRVAAGKKQCGSVRSRSRTDGSPPAVIKAARPCT